MERDADANGIYILRRSVEMLSEQVCSLRSEVTCGEHVIHQIMRKNRELRQAMIL